MADNTTLNTGSGGDVIATDDCAGVKYQQVKLVNGTLNATDAIGGDASNGLDVDVTRVQGTVTVDSELTTADLDTGAGTDTRAVVGLVGSKSGGGALIPGDATAGLKVDLGADNDVTVTNATASNLKAEVTGATSGSGTATGAIRVELPTNGTGVVGLNAGTNAIGKLAANSGVDIGDVDVTSVPTDPFGANADAASATGSISAKLRFIASTGIPVTGTVTVDSELAAAAALADGASNPTTPMVGAAVQYWNGSTWDRVRGNALDGQQITQRYKIWADSLADGISAAWTQSTANGGTVTTASGEGLLKTSTATNGSSQIVGPTITYQPGAYAWMNSAIRLGDTGTAGDIRRWGMFTVSGTTPQEGFYYELSGTTLNAVVVKAGTPTAVAVASWSLNSTAPFTLDTNFHSWEIRYTANTVQFLIDNVLRHVVTGTTTPLTTSLSLPIAATNVKTSGATDITLAIRNIGAGGFGDPGLFQIEDYAAADGDRGIYSLTHRKDTPASTSGTDGDYSGLTTDANGALHVALVSKNVENWIEVTIAGLTSASTAYTNGDVLGSEMTFASAARFAGGTCVIDTIEVINNATQLGAVDAFIFDSASTPASDNAANSWSDANAAKCVAVLPLYPAATSALNQVLQWEGVKKVKCASTSLFVVLVTRSDHTFFGAATDLLVKMNVIRS